MKGNNEITLNQATMVEAIQHYFQTVLFTAERVPIVKAVNQSIDSEEFIVKVSEKEA